MKIRIQENSIRVRLAIRELEELANGQAISMFTTIGPSKLGVSLQSSMLEPDFSFSDRIITFSFPFQYYQDLKNSDKEGFDLSFENTDGSSTFVSIEKDFACIGREKSKNEGLFQNPKAGNTTC